MISRLDAVVRIVIIIIDKGGFLQLPRNLFEFFTRNTLRLLDYYYFKSSVLLSL